MKKTTKKATTQTKQVTDERVPLQAPRKPIKPKESKKGQE